MSNPVPSGSHRIAAWLAKGLCLIALLHPSHAFAVPSISNITTNLSAVQKFEKFEITFLVDNTAAKNFYCMYAPYTSNDPYPNASSFIELEQGITVDAQFLPPNVGDWSRAYIQPAFYFQDFTHENHLSMPSFSDWYYPTGTSAWKVRFAPTVEGTWRFRLMARDASGSTASSEQIFTVLSPDAASSSRHGFVRASSKDKRYFEYDDGTYFPGLGYNMNYDQIQWLNPETDLNTTAPPSDNRNPSNFLAMGRNGIQLIRMWLCQWSIFGSDWNPWKGVGAAYYTPWTWLSYDPGTSPQSEFAVWIDQDNNKCMSYGVNTYHPAVKPNTQYRVRISYKTGNVTGPRVAGHPYGLVVKLLHIFDTRTCGEWDFGGQMQYGKYITPFQSADVSTWQILQGIFTTDPGQYFLPYIHLAMENANSGSWATVRQIWIEEVLGNGQYGPNIVSKPSMDHHLYIDQRNAFAFDRVVEMAKQNGVYLRPVILFWQETILNSLDWNGNYTATQSNSYYYGDGNYGMTRGRWLQTQWYRYLQARWGYSTAIHSWEFTNEGTPGAEHAAAANYFGRVMHGRYSAGTYDPTRYYGNWHLSATSIWAGNTANWGLDNYPDIDFADFHQYIPRSDPNFYDSAQATYDASMANGRVGRPVMRGETGFTDSGSEPPTSALQADTAGVWLHNFVWGGINPGGVLESYWYSNYHICTASFDLRPQYKTYYEFAKGVPLNNGFFVDAAATAPTGVRAWGQKDLTNGQAILWISNASHTWDNVVNNRSIIPRSGTVVVGGLQASKDYNVEWWNTYQTDPAQMVTRRETVRTDGSGNLALAISNLTTDVAVKVSSTGIPAAPKNLRIR